MVTVVGDIVAAIVVVVPACFHHSSPRRTNLLLLSLCIQNLCSPKLTQSLRSAKNVVVDVLFSCVSIVVVVVSLLCI